MNEKTIKVAAHWYNDGGDVEIVNLVSLDHDRELQNDLFWYAGSQRPFWPQGMLLSDEDVQATRCYKMRKMQSIQADIPDDCYMPMEVSR